VPLGDQGTYHQEHANQDHKYDRDLPLRRLLCSAADEGNASQEPAFMMRDDGKILGTVLGVFWEHLSNDCAALAETQDHRLRAAAAQPEILRFARKTAGVEFTARARCRVGFKSKKSSFL